MVWNNDHELQMWVSQDGSNFEWISRAFINKSSYCFGSKNWSCSLSHWCTVMRSLKALTFWKLPARSNATALDLRKWLCFSSRLPQYWNDRGKFGRCPGFCTAVHCKWVVFSVSFPTKTVYYIYSTVLPNVARATVNLLLSTLVWQQVSQAVNLC